jgi:hypothetical protein
MQANPGRLSFQPQQQQVAAASGMSEEQMQIMSLQQQQAQLMNQLQMLQGGGKTPALGVTPGSSQLASAAQSFATLPASNTTGQFQQPQLQKTSNEVFPSMSMQQQPATQLQPTNQQLNGSSFVAPRTMGNNSNIEMELNPAVSEQFINSTAFLQKVLEDSKKAEPDMNTATWGAQAPDAAAATSGANIHVHHVNIAHQQKPASTNNRTRRQNSSLSLGMQSKSGSDGLNMSDISSNFSISSLTTLTSLKHDGTKKDEVSDISTSGSDEKKKSAGTDSPPESDESGAKQARSRKRQHSPPEGMEAGGSNKKVRVVDPAALGGKPCISKRDSGELSSESSWASSNDDDNNQGTAYFSGMSTAKGLSVVKSQRSYNSEVSSVSASGSDRGSDDGKEETNAC